MNLEVRMKIGIMGTHGIGKTTLAAQMFAYASMTGRKAKLIHEVARSCPLPINEKFTVKAATWIVARHVTLGIEAEAAGYDFIICDRSSFDPVTYAINIIPNDLREKKFYRTSPLYKFAERDLRSYDVLIYLKPSSAEILSDGIRAVDPEFQKKIAKIFDEELHHMGIGFHSYETNPIIEMPCSRITMNSKDVFERDNTGFFEYILKKISNCLPDQSAKFFNFAPYSDRI